MTAYFESAQLALTEQCALNNQVSEVVMRKIILVSFIVLSFATPSKAIDYYYDGLDFAIQHFNSNHQADLTAWSPEHRFMRDALLAVANKVKDVSEIKNYHYSNLDQNPFQAIEKTLRVFEGSSSEDASQKEASELVLLANQLSNDCPFQRETHLLERDSGVGSLSSLKSVKTVYSLEAPDKRSARNCSQAELIEKLNTIGINEVVISVKEPYSSAKEYRVILRNKWNLRRDMNYVKAELLKVPQVVGLVSKLAPMSNAPHQGKANSIQLSRTSGSATFTEEFEFTYRLGWGDCPSGCSRNHQWVILLKPKGQDVDETYLFDVTVKSDTGDPVPPPGERH